MADIRATPIFHWRVVVNFPVSRMVSALVELHSRRNDVGGRKFAVFAPTPQSLVTTQANPQKAIVYVNKHAF